MVPLFMSELIVVRVSSSGVIVSPEVYADREFVERVKMLARAARKLIRLWGSSDSRLVLEWSGGRVVYRIGSEDLLAVFVLRKKVGGDSLGLRSWE